MFANTAVAYHSGAPDLSTNFVINVSRGQTVCLFDQKKIYKIFTWIVATSVYSKKIAAAVAKKFSASTGSA
jgi:hypothetical protein